MRKAAVWAGAHLPTLSLALHPDKSRIFPLHHGTRWVGYRVFPYHRLPTKANRRHFLCRLADWEAAYAEGTLSPPAFIERVNGWLAYAAFADTFAFRCSIQQRLRALQEKNIGG